MKLSDANSSFANSFSSYDSRIPSVRSTRSPKWIVLLANTPYDVAVCTVSLSPVVRSRRTVPAHGTPSESLQPQVFGGSPGVPPVAALKLLELNALISDSRGDPESSLK